MGLAGDNYVTTGVVICLQGMPPSADSLDEWCTASQRVGWLDLGISVVVPNLQMSPSLQRVDLVAVVNAALKVAGFDRCMIVGKDWGAQIAVELASDMALGGNVVGVVLVGPSSPPTVDCNKLEVPACLLWAHDDDVTPFGDLEGWLDALDNRCAPTTVQECDTGGHRIDSILDKSNEGVAKFLHNFTVTSLLIADLAESQAQQKEAAAPIDPKGEQDGHKAMEGTAAEDDEDREEEEPRRVPSKEKVSERISRLSAELPPFLAERVGQNDQEPDKSGAAEQHNQKRRLSRELPNWIQSGMTTSSE